MLWNSFGSMVNLACQWLITVLVVRISNGYDAAGTLALAMSVYNTFAPVAVYRMYTYQVSDVKRENTVGEYVSFRVITCFIAFALIVVYSLLSCPFDSLAVIVAYSLYKVAGLFIDVLHGVDQVNERMDYIGRSLIMQGIVSLALFCIVELLFHTLEFTLVCMMIGTILVGLLYDLPRSSRFESVRLGISGNKVLHLLGYCFPIVAGAVACGAAPSIPRQFLAFSDGQAALGIYASVAAPVTIIQMGASYIYNPLLGYFSQAYAEHDLRRLSLLLGRAFFGIALIGIVAAAILELTGEWVLSLMYGSGIVSYMYLLIPIIACSLVTAYVWFLNDVLVSFRDFKGSVVGNAIAVVLSAVTSVVFVPAFAMNGVSFAHLLSYGSSAIVMLVFLFRLFCSSRKVTERSS